MATDARRDVNAVLKGLQAWLDAQDPDSVSEVVGHQHPSAGYSGETILVDVRRSSAGSSGVERLALKLPPTGTGIFPTYDFTLQAAVQSAAAAAGVPVPVPVQNESDTRWLGVPFLVMPAIPGHIIDDVPVRDPWLTEVEPELNTAVHGSYFDVLADIHRVDWRAAGLEHVVPMRDNAAEIAYWRGYLAWFADGARLAPTLLEALDWCGRHQPASEPTPSLLWGDVRLGNVIFDETRAPIAVLDWEMASIGAAEHDLGWALALEATQQELLRRTVPGFLERRDAVARYEARLGRRSQDLAWYETLAMVRSTAIMTKVAHLQELAGEPASLPISDNPLLHILRRRIAESEESQ